MAGIVAARAGHQFVRASAVENHRAGVSIVTMQSLIASGTDHPDDRVIGAVGGSHKG